MIVTRQKSPTHVKIQRIDYFIKSFKVIAVFCFLNIILIIANFVWHGLTYSYLSLKNFDDLLIVEAALSMIFGSLTIATRPVAEKVIEESPEDIKRGVIFNRDVSKLFQPLEGSFIHRFFTREIVARKQNIAGIVGFLTSGLLIILSITLDVLFISKRLY